MSFVLTHGLQGYLFRFIPIKKKWWKWFVLIIITTSMLPDIIPISETIQGNYSNLYAWSHGAELKTNINNEIQNIKDKTNFFLNEKQNIQSTSQDVLYSSQALLML